MSKYAIITVGAESDKLHALDRSVEGLYGVVLDDDARPRNVLEEGQDPLVEAALDRFHDKVAIQVLDDFDIDVEVFETQDECPNEVEWL